MLGTMAKRKTGAEPKPDKEEPQTEVPITLRFPVGLHAKLKADAARCFRSFNQHLLWIADQHIKAVESEGQAGAGP